MGAPYDTLKSFQKIFSNYLKIYNKKLGKFKEKLILLKFLH
jgi:hypothetical protein